MKYYKKIQKKYSISIKEKEYNFPFINKLSRENKQQVQCKEPVWEVEINQFALLE